MYNKAIQGKFPERWLLKMLSDYKKNKTKTKASNCGFYFFFSAGHETSSRTDRRERREREERREEEERERLHNSHGTVHLILILACKTSCQLDTLNKNDKICYPACRLSSTLNKVTETHQVFPPLVKSLFCSFFVTFKF